MKELAAQYHSLLHKKTVHCKKDTGCLVIRAYTMGNDDSYMGGGIICKTENVYKVLV